MRLFIFIVRFAVLVTLVVGGACAADFIWRKVNPENTRHARFGDACLDIHRDYALEDGKAPPAHCITVHFGTPRKPIGAKGEPDFGFGREFDGKLHLGVAQVSLPLLASEEKDGQAGVRKRGEVDLKPDGAPDSKDDTIKFASITLIAETEEQQFVTSLSEALFDADTSSLLVFVHGYNQSFDSALIRAAQIAVDLTFDPDDPANTKSNLGYGEPSFAFGTPVLFSWPNGNFLCAYCSDQTKAELSAPYLAEFLALLMSEKHGMVDEINIVVHSMGNRVLVKAIEDIAREHVRLKLIKRFRIVNAAADVARDEYAAAMARAERAGADGEFAPQVTIYAAQNDIAMAASFLVNGFKARLGQIIPTQRPFESTDERYVTIDTDVVSADLFGHGYYSESGNVIADMSCFFADRPVGAERAIAPVAPLSDGRRHYRFVAPDEAGLKVCAPGAAPLKLADAEAYFSSIGLSYDDYGRRRSDQISPVVMAEPSAPTRQDQLVSVYFDYGSAELNEPASYMLEEAVQNATDATRIEIVGHADAAEEADGVADEISKRRAEIVRDYLVSRGVDQAIIEVRGVGANEPMLVRGPGVREPVNRRVEINISY